MSTVRKAAITGRRHFGHDLGFYAKSGLLARLARRAGVSIPPLTEVAAVDPLPAILNRDQWIVACPDCGVSASYVWLEQPLVMCSYCWNFAVGGLWRPVQLPTQRVREVIELLVGQRPFPHTRNWRGEAISALQAENRVAGLSDRTV